MNPIKSDLNIITQPFKGQAHRGVDLRSVELPSGKLLPVILTEPAKCLRTGIDPLGNDYAVFLTDNFDEIKYIHVSYNDKIIPGTEYKEGQEIGFTHIKNDVLDKSGKVIYKGIGRGNSTAHHLHFETWKDGKPFDPVEYFYQRYIKYDFKK